MSTIWQIQANRMNAAKSTGPRTDEGKAVVSINARKHGILASEVIVPGEDSNQFESYSADLTKSMAPEGALEELLADRIVSLSWRLRRIGRVETAMLAWQHYSDLEDRARKEANSLVEHKEVDEAFAALRKKGIIRDEPSHRAATGKAKEFRDLRDAEFPTSGMTFLKRVASVGLVQRYETSIERSLYKALHELQRIQAFRLGLPASIPVAIDVHGDSNVER